MDEASRKYVLFQMSVTKIFVPYLSSLYTPYMTNVYLCKWCLYFGFITFCQQSQILEHCDSCHKHSSLAFFTPPIQIKQRSSLFMPFSCCHFLVLIWKGEAWRRGLSLELQRCIYINFTEGDVQWDWNSAG